MTETTSLVPLFRIVPGAGNRSAKIVLVGEAPSKDEDKLLLPFVGQAGQELTRILGDAGISRREVYLTNVFKHRPPDSKLKDILVTKKEVSHDLPPVQAGKYISDDDLHYVEDLFLEIEAIQPNITVALGATAAWALLGINKISRARGYIHWNDRIGKVIGTYHPAAILRVWNYRVIAVADLLKARRESRSPDLYEPQRELKIGLSFRETLDWLKALLTQPETVYDIETSHGTITCLGFSISPTEAISIPLVDSSKPDLCHWTRSEEIEILRAVREVLLCRSLKKFCQNGLYDLQWTWTLLGCPIYNFCEDTMILHHSIYPEMEKSLNFLGSIYTNTPQWKDRSLRSEYKAGEDK